jgi:putative DNA primase/helicase
VAGVGEAAIKEGLLPWPAGEAIHAASVCFGSWIAARGGTSNLESDQAIAQIPCLKDLP